METEFQSAVTRGGNVLTPEKIMITDTLVTWRRRNRFLIGFDSISIPREKISCIEVNVRIWGADISISSFGETKILARNFTVADAERIKEILSE